MFLQRVQKPHKKSPLDTTVKAFLLHPFKRRYSKNTAMATKIDEVFANNLIDRILLLSKLGLKLGLATPDGEHKAPDREQVKDLTTFVDFTYSHQQCIWSDLNNKNMFAQCETEDVLDC